MFLTQEVQTLQVGKKKTYTLKNNINNKNKKMELALAEKKELWLLWDHLDTLGIDEMNPRGWFWAEKSRLTEEYSAMNTDHKIKFWQIRIKTKSGVSADSGRHRTIWIPRTGTREDFARFFSKVFRQPKIWLGSDF